MRVKTKKEIEREKLLKDLAVKLRELTDEERMELFSDYCMHCGCYDDDEVIKCQCWNDE